MNESAGTLPSIARVSWLLALAAAGCASPPPPPKKAPEDPAVILRRQHDEWWAALAATYDQNHDGRIEPSEYGRDPATFARLDRDHDGSVTRADFEKDLVLPADLVLPMMLNKLAGERDAESVEIAAALEAMVRLDKNGDGRIDRAEFEAGGTAYMPGVDTFATFLSGMDADHDGLLSRTEIASWMARRDSDHDGKLARRERIGEGPAPAEGFIRPRDREKAPDFTAAPLAGGAPVTLASLVGKRPVALVFGSFT